MEIKVNQIFEAIEAVAKQNFLSEEETREIFEEAVKKAFYIKYDPDAELELIMDQETQIFKLINKSKFVVEDEEYNEEYRALEIPLSDAKKIDKKAKIGSLVAEDVDFQTYASALLQSIRQMFTQQVREKKKEAVYAKHKSLKGEMIDVTVTSITNNYSIFALEDGTTAFMPSNLRNPKIKLGVGQRTKVFVEDVLEESKDAQVIVSNGSKEVVKRVLEVEVPEIAQGIVEIVSIARMPGLRSKIAVKSTNPQIDPVGTIIGERGSRITSIIEKLDGEKIDVILWSADENVYVANSLSPAKIVSVQDKVIGEGKVNGKIVIAPNKHQTLAIGKKGSNVRLAVELTGIKVDVISMEDAKTKSLEILWNTGVTEEQVQAIEEGRRVSSFRSNRSKPVNMDTASLANEIESFTNEILDDDTDDSNFEDFKIDEDLFSDEAIKGMEAEFEFDEELENYDTNEEDNIE